MKSLIWVMLLGMIFPFTGLAQTALFNQQSTISVGTNSVLFVEGSVVNQAGSSVLENKGEIWVSRDWNNQASYQATNSGAKGKVRFVGPDTSRIQGLAMNSHAFSRLEIDKTISPVLLETRITVSDSLRLTDGYVYAKTPSEFLYLSHPSPGILTGHPSAGAASDDRYLAASLYREVNQTGVAYDFPVGTPPSEEGYQLLQSNFDVLGTTSRVDVAFQAGASPPANTSECGATFDCVLGDHGSWSLLPNGTGSQFDLVVVPRNFTSSCGAGSYTIMDNSSLEGQACSGFSGTLDPNLGTEIPRNNLTSVSGLAITGSAAPFPVEWLSFEVWKEETGARLQWITAAEEGVDYFQVEHSLDGQSFQAVGQVRSQGSRQQLSTYDFLDPTPEPGHNFYRIRQIDLDGTFSFSEIRSLTWENGGIWVGPNPFQDQLLVKLPSSLRYPVKLHLFNALGQKVWETEWTSGGETAFPSPALPEGTYFYQLQSPGQNLGQGRLIHLE